MIRKVVIPDAVLGTRLFPATEGQPKEMLPIFSYTASSNMSAKPVVQVVLEQLYDAGLRGFRYVVGRGKRDLEGHFTPDANCVRTLEYISRDAILTSSKMFTEI